VRNEPRPAARHNRPSPQNQARFEAAYLEPYPYPERQLLTSEAKGRASCSRPVLEKSHRDESFDHLITGWLPNTDR
jgi:hypothetical protein